MERHQVAWYVTVGLAGRLWGSVRFPVTVGPDTTFNGFVDAFVAKVNASGTALDYAGYIGGTGSDSGRGIAVDSAGSAYVDRSRVRPGMAVAGGVLVEAFRSVGWGWGGTWAGSPDYQHFSVNGR